jgi:hypothetical protein
VQEKPFTDRFTLEVGFAYAVYNGRNLGFGITWNFEPKTQ